MARVCEQWAETQCFVYRVNGRLSAPLGQMWGSGAPLAMFWISHSPQNMTGGSSTPMHPISSPPSAPA